jgi:hypothetical protein
LNPSEAKTQLLTNILSHYGKSDMEDLQEDSFYESFLEGTAAEDAVAKATFIGRAKASLQKFLGT